MIYKELSVNLGSESLRQYEISNSAFLLQKNVIESKIQYLEDHNKEIEQTIDSLASYDCQEVESLVDIVELF